MIGKEPGMPDQPDNATQSPEQPTTLPPRKVVCPKHNLTYDANLYDGCAVCRMAQKHQEEMDRKYGKFATPLMLILLVVLGYALWSLLDHYHLLGIQVQGQNRTRGLQVDPAPYQIEIQNLETKLYSGDSFSQQDGQDIALAVQVIGDRMVDNRSRAVSAGGALLETFSSQIGSTARSLDQNPDPGLKQTWVRQWQDLRAGIFNQAAWFHQPLTTTAQPAPAPAP